MYSIYILLFLLALTFARGDEECGLSNELIKEIQSYQETVNKIINSTTKGQLKGKTYNELAEFVDTFGARQAGSQSLENAIDYMLDLMKNNSLENVHGENVTVPHWVRGTENCTMIHPRVANIPVLALGGSVGTPSEGIEAEVVVVKSFDDLHQNYSKSVKGKIVVFNYEFETYPVSIVYRSNGAIEASQYGALAALVRSVTPFSMNSLHTGQMQYSENVTKIPEAAITVEHAHLFQRYQDRGEKIVLKLNISTQDLPPVISRNSIAEVVGSQHPEKVVLVSGHLDSWDVGVGAMDDGGGAFISWYSLVVLKTLGLRPKRTVRAVLWTAEETGYEGIIEYDRAHKNELDNFTFALESDEGAFTPTGLEYVAGTKGGCIIKEIMKLLTSINATQAVSSKEVGSDIILWKDVIPTGSLLNKNEQYFWYHHSKGDTMDVLDPDALDKATALWASVAYIIADLEEDFPRELLKLNSASSTIVTRPTYFCIIFIVISVFFNTFW